MYYPALDRKRLSLKEQDFLSFYFIRERPKARVMDRLNIKKTRFYEIRSKLLKMILEAHTKQHM